MSCLFIHAQKITRHSFLTMINVRLYVPSQPSNVSHLRQRHMSPADFHFTYSPSLCNTDVYINDFSLFLLSFLRFSILKVHHVFSIVKNVRAFVPLSFSTIILIYYYGFYSVLAFPKSTMSTVDIQEFYLCPAGKINIFVQLDFQEFH